MKNLYLACISVLFCINAIGQVDFMTVSVEEPNFRTISNCVVDMNGDFLDDIVAVSKGLMVIYYQQETGGFKTKRFRIPFRNLPNWSIAAADIDANGFNDLLISDAAAISFLMSDENGGSYTEEYKDEYIYGQRSSFADINNDGHLDAFICNDVDQNHPYVNDGSGNLTLDFDLIWTPDDVPGNYAVTWVDYDNDEDMDMYLTKCVQGASTGDPSRTNLLYQNDGLGNFTEVGAQAGMDDNDQSWVTLFEDYDNDGDFDAVIFNHEFNHKFMLNNGDGTFTDILPQIGVLDQVSNVREAFAADFDNNGFVDFMINEPPSIYFNNGDLTFTKQVINFYPGAIGDLNDDGWIDNVRFNQMFINEGNGNNWFKVNLRGRESNSNGIGARCELYGDWGVQIRELRCTQGFLGMSSLSTHFGLAQNQSIDSLVIKWPSGQKTIIDQPAINETMIVDEAGCNYNRPDLQLSGSSLLCAGDSITISVSTQNNVLWNTGEVTSDITVHNSGVYNATITDTNGCTNITKSVTILDAEDPVEVYAPFGDRVCGGSAVLLEVDTQLPVVWNTGQSTPYLYTNNEGSYSVTVETNCPEPTISEAYPIIEHIVDPPLVVDAYFNPDSIGLDFVVEVESEAEFVTWWTSGSMVLGSGTSLLLSTEFVNRDTTFFVQACDIINGSQCCSPLVPINIFFSSVEEELQELGLRVYPNPVQDQLTVELGSISGEVSLSLWDIMGQNILGEIKLEQSHNLIDLGEQVAGHYILQLVVADKRIFRKIVITD